MLSERSISVGYEMLRFAQHDKAEFSVDIELSIAFELCININVSRETFIKFDHVILAFLFPELILCSKQRTATISSSSIY